jgi:hypothetical protein
VEVAAATRVGASGVARVDNPGGKCFGFRASVGSSGVARADNPGGKRFRSGPKNRENFTSQPLHQLKMHTIIKHEYQDFFYLDED